MKSYIKNVAPFEKVELPYLDIELTEGDIQSEVNLHIKTALMEHRYYLAAETVKEGSIVTADIFDEDNNLLRRDLIIRPGRGFFSPSIESALIGKKEHETLSTSYEGRSITLKIKKIQDKVIPELNDETVKSFKIEGVATKDEYLAYLKQYYLDFYMENYLIYFSMEFFDNLMKASEIVKDDEEYSRCFNTYVALQDKYYAAHDSSFYGTHEEYLEYCEGEFASTFNLYLYKEYLDGNRDNEFTLNTFNEIEAVRNECFKDIIEFLRDKTKFVWVTEEGEDVD